MAEFNITARLEKLIQKISGEQVDAILIRKPENLFYFSGFNGDSSVLFIGKNFRKPKLKQKILKLFGRLKDCLRNLPKKLKTVSLKL